MAYIEGHARDQMLLIPASIEDYISADNPVRFLEEFVDGLDLAAAGFARSTPKVVGRPGYAPGDLLKLYLYGYLNRVRSSRRLSTEAGRNLELMWLLRGLRPDFRTISDFRADNKDALKPVFRAFVMLWRRLDLFGRELLAVDGTRLKAVNSRRRNFTRQKLADWIKLAGASSAARCDATPAVARPCSTRGRTTLRRFLSCRNSGAGARRRTDWSARADDLPRQAD